MKGIFSLFVAPIVAHFSCDNIEKVEWKDISNGAAASMTAANSNHNNLWMLSDQDLKNGGKFIAQYDAEKE